MQHSIVPSMAVHGQFGRDSATSSRQGDNMHMLGAQSQTVWLHTSAEQFLVEEEMEMDLDMPRLPYAYASAHIRPEDQHNGIESLFLSDSWAALDARSPPESNLEFQWSAVQIPAKLASSSRHMRCPRRCIGFGEGSENLQEQKHMSAKGIAGLLSLASSPQESALELEWQVVVDRQADFPSLESSDSSFAAPGWRRSFEEDGFVPVTGDQESDGGSIDNGTSDSSSSSRSGMEHLGDGESIWFPDRSSVDDDQSRMLSNSVICSSFLSPPGTPSKLQTGTSVWWRTASPKELAALVARKAADCLENCDLPAATTDGFVAVSSPTEYKSQAQTESSVWWRTAGKHELAALVAQKASDCLENCDLPTPQSSESSPQMKTRSPSYYELSLSQSMNKKMMESLFSKDNQTQLENLGLPPTLLNIIFGNSSMSVAPGSLQHKELELPESSKTATIASPSWDDSQRVNSLSGSWCGEEGESSCFEREPGLLGQALCRSQTRAREAEKDARQARKTAEIANREKEQLAHMFCREAATLTYYRRRVASLEAENFCLRTFCKKNCVWVQHSTFNPIKALEHLSHYHWKNTGKEHTVRYQLLQMREKKHSPIKWRSDGSCVVMESTVGLAFTLGLSLAGAGLMLGWSMR